MNKDMNIDPAIAKQVAEALLDIKAVGFVLDKPITFKSGIISPMYIDNRKFPSHPAAWRAVLDGFISTLSQKNIAYDMIAGIETAGIPHSAALSALLSQPSVFVRKAAKDHGTKKMVEGGDVSGQKVLLIEDLVTTGGSSLHGVTELRNAGATVTDCLVIISYGFPESATAFANAGVTLHPLTTIDAVMAVAEERGILTTENKATVMAWYQDPWSWKKVQPPSTI